MTIFTPEIAHYLDTLRGEIESALARFSSPPSDCPKRLGEAVRYVLLAPGKRLRPLLTLWAAELCGGNRKEAIAAACAVEMIHAYSLVHDDLPAMDDDDLRRGRPTCHIQYGEAEAILAGDALQALAFRTLADRTTPRALIGACVKILGDAAGWGGMVGGQSDDMLEETGFQPADPAAWIGAVHARKTGALIRASLELGATVAGGIDKHVRALKNYGEHFGLAFQITDDLLDWSGDEATVGKRLRKDVDRCKLTWPLVHGYEQAGTHAAEAVEAAVDALAEFQPCLDGAVRQLAYDALVAHAKYLLERRA